MTLDCSNFTQIQEICGNNSCDCVIGLLNPSQLLYIMIPAIWFVFLWIGRIIFMSCECGALWHTRKEMYSFIYFAIFSFVSTLILSLILWWLG